jgi:hypothetical protein
MARSADNDCLAVAGHGDGVTLSGLADGIVSEQLVALLRPVSHVVAHENPGGSYGVVVVRSPDDRGVAVGGQGHGGPLMSLPLSDTLSDQLVALLRPCPVAADEDPRRTYYGGVKLAADHERVTVGGQRDGAALFRRRARVVTLNERLLRIGSFGVGAGKHPHRPGLRGVLRPAESEGVAIGGHRNRSALGGRADKVVRDIKLVPLRRIHIESTHRCYRYSSDP